MLHVAAQAVYDANHLLAPFLPHASQKVYEALGGSGVFSPLPRLEEVEDLDKPGFTYPIITGDYKLGETVHPWESERLVAGTPVPKPHPISRKFRLRLWPRSSPASTPSSPPARRPRLSGSPRPKPNSSSEI